MDLHWRRKRVRGWGIASFGVLQPTWLGVELWFLRPLPRHQPFQVGLWDMYPQKDFMII
jgi:hypothetical protein